MSKTTLKILRLFLPGIIFAILMVPVYFTWKTNPVSDIISILEHIIYYGLAGAMIFVGALYYIFDCRKCLWKPFVSKCHLNIKKTFLTISNEKNLSTIEPKAFVRIFYHFVDTDSSLKDQSDDVRFNGLILTSIIDSLILLLISTPLYIFNAIKFNNKLSFVTLAISAILLIILTIAKAKAAKKHLALENEQLSVILLKYESELNLMLQKLAKQ